MKEKPTIIKYLIFLIGFIVANSIPLHAQSVLSEGDWYRIAVEKNGLYHLTYQDFEEMGFDMDQIDPDQIQIYGNVEGVLPEANQVVVNEQLIENAIFVTGAEDGSFDTDDEVLFYANGAHQWVYEKF